MTNRYRVFAGSATGLGRTYYLGEDSREAWDKYRKVSARGALLGERVALMRWNAEALGGMGRWDTVLA